MGRGFEGALPLFGGMPGGQQAVMEQVQPIPPDPRKCLRLTVQTEYSSIEALWFACPGDKEEPDITLKVDQINRATGQVMKTVDRKVPRTESQLQGTIFMVTRAYTTTISKISVLREVTLVGVPFIIELVDKPEWWKDRDKNDPDAKE